ncbi:arylsulfatase [Rhodoblastus acidophilus]|nr:arylsulfatase [Rhodoblastus acidophilus]RAI17818.1 arylsulfatase [Rhodoblastus acidophilus]
MSPSKCLLLLGVSGLVLTGAARAGAAEESLPKPPPAFAGKIDIDRDKSTPDWPKAVKPRDGAPNVVVILLDDVGFSATSALGGPVSTPELDKLAAGGLRYNNFHVNSMCSPTRASLLTGRNSHKVGFGNITELAAGYPGYTSILRKDSAGIAEVLRQNGYATAAFGKWHNTPVWEAGPTGPFDHWPTHLGFEHFYGFVKAADSQYEPQLFRDTVPVEPTRTPAQGYHFTTDIVDEAVSWLHQEDAVTPEKPFFIYFAPGATHAPLQVPQQWVDKYKGKFDAGWDKIREETYKRQKQIGAIPANAELTPRPAELPAWDSLTPDQKKLLARQAEVYAGFLEHTDYEVGRLLKAIADEGKGDNTLVLYVVGDNGASFEGGLEGSDFAGLDGKPEPLETRLQEAGKLGGELVFNSYATAWGWAFDAPFQWGKQVASHLGGTTDPLVVSWPGHIKDGGAVRGQFSHVTDIAPTIYEAAGVAFPKSVDGAEQIPLDGTSLLPSIASAKAPTAHTIQYFEMLGNRGIYKDGWWAGARHLLPWRSAQQIHSAKIGDRPWELYNLNEDYSQAHDLAEKNPGKLKELVELFDEEAKRNNVYPLAPRWDRPPSPSDNRTLFVYRPGAERIPENILPPLRGRAYALTAEVSIPDARTEGVIVADGGRFGGFSLYVKDGKLIYEASAAGHTVGKIVAEKLPLGDARIVVELQPDEAGGDAGPALFGPARAATARLSVNGKPAGETHLVNASAFSHESLEVGKDLSSPVSPDYSAPFVFTGKIDKVTLQLK